MPLLSMLTQQDIQRIHQATMEVLGTVGVAFHLEKAVNLFKAHGFRTDGNIVFFTEKQVMEAVRQVPRSFHMEARNPEYHFTIGGGSPCMGGGNGYVSIIGPEGQRPASFADTINLIKLQQSSDCVHMTSGHGISAMDITGNIALAHAMMLNCYLSDKPLQALGFNAQCASISLDLARIVFGGGISDKYVCMGALNPTSPLQWVGDVAEALFVYAEANQPVEIAPAGILGTTTPVTTAGGVVCANAEILSGVVLMQLIQPGLPVIPGNTSSCPDMKTMAMAMGAPEGAVMSAALNDMIHHYGMPARSGGPYSDAKDLDCQAGAEAVVQLLIPMLSGTDYLFHMGMCDSYSSFSYEKFIADEDVFHMCARIVKGLDTAEPELAVDQLRQVARQGSFLQSMFTVKRFRKEFWQPKVFERRPYEAWAGKGGAESRRECCRAAWQNRLKTFQRPDIDPATARDLWKYVHENYGRIEWLTAESCSRFEYATS